MPRRSRGPTPGASAAGSGEPRGRRIRPGGSSPIGWPRRARRGWLGGLRAYATSKLATVDRTHALARRLPTGVDVYSSNPALVADTNLFHDAPRPLRVMLNGFFRAQLAVGRGSTLQQADAVLAEAFAGPQPRPDQLLPGLRR